MSEEDNYISLQTATKYCDYSQEYLSLRARQGKLKAVKFGRNWMTQKEWLEEYIMENQKSLDPALSRKIRETPHRVAIKNQKLDLKQIPNLFQRPKFRYALQYALAGVLVFSLLTTGIVFALQRVQDKDDIWLAKDTLIKNSRELFSATFENTSAALSDIDLHPVQDFKEMMSFVAGTGSEGISVVSQKANNVSDELTTIIGGSIINSKIYLAEVISETEGSFKYGLNSFQKLSRWYGEQAVAVDKKVKETPAKIGQKIVNTGIAFKQGYRNTNDFVEEKLSQVYPIIKDPFKQAYEFFIFPWGKELKQEEFVAEKTNEELRQEVGILQAKIEKIERERLSQKEIREVFRKAEKLKRDYISASLLSALTEEREENVSAAIARLESMAMDFPLNTEVLFQLGRLYLNEDRIDDAIAQFEKVLKLNSDNEDVREKIRELRK